MNIRFTFAAEMLLTCLPQGRCKHFLPPLCLRSPWQIQLLSEFIRFTHRVIGERLVGRIWLALKQPPWKVFIRHEWWLPMDVQMGFPALVLRSRYTLALSRVPSSWLLMAELYTTRRQRWSGYSEEGPLAHSILFFWERETSVVHSPTKLMFCSQDQ